MAIPNTIKGKVVDHYLEQCISSIDVVQKLSIGQKVQLNPRQCEYLSLSLTETGGFLRAKFESLISIRDSADTRQKALLQLYFAVRRAEKLVRGCCCEREPWLDSAVTLAHVTEDIKDILLDVRWWTSMIDIAIASTRWSRNSSGQKAVLELLISAEEHYRELLDNLHMSNNGLEMAASRDEDLLLRKVRDVETSYAGKDRTAEQNHDYLLAVHVRSRLEKWEVETMEELNAYEYVSMIGQGGFGAVLNVKWLGRRCALKMLKQKCKDEATSLREFNHPHIVKFFRYWEAPYVTPRGTPHGSPRSDDPMQSYAALQSHILMELLPMDLAQHLQNLRRTVNFTGSKRGPEHTQGASLPVDVALDTMLQMVKAMWHLNSKYVAHRDLKPHNVLVRPVSDDEVPELNYRGYVRAKLADFGLAKTRALSSTLSTQPTLGTKIYAAPEVFNKDIIRKKKYPRKADVWSFGIMFCEVLSGKAPFPGIEDGTYTLAELHRRIKDGLRPRLPDNCSDYLKFIITSCLELLPENRPNFSDLLRLVRLAQVQSLGFIQKDHDLYFYKSKNGVRSLRPFKVAPAPAPVPFVPSEAPEGELKSKSVWWTILRWNILLWLMRRRDVSFQRRLSKASEVSTSRSQAESKPLGFLVNQVGPDTSNSKLDVIFFEGNVGRRKDLSCKDTWVQRGKPDVWWPRDWLPKDLGDDIRVLLLEYSISDDGVEGVVEHLQRLMVFSERWNRGSTWNRPIVLVGHSLGCVVIERLVVALDRRARSIETLDDDVEMVRARVAQEFLTSLAGCFFYAPPWTGLVPSEGLLKHVFGGLTYTKELFSGLCLDSPELKVLSEDFIRAKRKHMKLTALVEGFHTLGRTVVPVASMQNFAGTIVELVDSNHTNVCKPTNKQHEAYRELVKFAGDILENSKAIRSAYDMNQQDLSDGEQYLLIGKKGFNNHGDLALSGMDGELSEFSIVDGIGVEHGVESGPLLAFRGLSTSNFEKAEAIEVNALCTTRKTGEEFLVNQVWPLESSYACKSTKLNIIFFEGNVGNRKCMSAEDTWVQRGNSGVCWPQDWLPVDLGDTLPVDTRVLLLKYQISDFSGLEGIVTDMQERLIYSDRWNQNGEWENPILLVGHSIGCVVIQDLVVRLHHMSQPIANTSNDLVKMQANASRAFIKNLSGCFFYAPPLKGFVPSESVLRVVFGGLNFSRNLFWDFAESSPKLRMLLEEFALMIATRRIRLGVLLEGKKTEGEMVAVSPVELMNCVLNDSDHSEVCKPTNKDHRSYKELFDFVLATPPIQGLLSTDSYQCVDKSNQSRDSKNSELSNEDGSFIVVEGPINSFSDDPKLSRNSFNDIHNAEDQEVLILKQADQYINVFEENKELFSVVKQKINEIDNVVEVQQVDALDFISGESQVLIICNHSDKDNALVFHFLDEQNMAKVVGVGLDYAKIILRNGVDIEVQEIVKSEWESAWFESKSIENATYKILKVTVPMQDDIKPTRILTQKEHVGIVMARPLLWDVAKYFTLKKILATLSHTGAEVDGLSSKHGHGQGQGNGSGNSNDTKTTKRYSFMLFGHGFQ